MTEWVKYMGSQIDAEVLEESALAQAQSVIQNAINEAGLSRSELARNMECNRSFVSRMLSGSHNLTVRTMARALAACGFEVRFQKVPTVWSWGTETVRPCEQALPASQGQCHTHSSVGIALPLCA
jgi:DNA-binding phage protein